MIIKFIIVEQTSDDALARINIAHRCLPRRIDEIIRLKGKCERDLLKELHLYTIRTYSFHHSLETKIKI